MNVLVIDVGTTNFKIYVIDENGNPLSVFKSRELAYDKLKNSIELIKNFSSNAQAIAVTGQSFVPIFLDKDEKIIKPVISYLDERSAIGYSDLKRKVKKPGYVATKLYSSLLWFKQNKPKTFKSIMKVFDIKEYMGFLLTGKHVYDSIELSDLEKRAILRELELNEEILGEPHDYTKPIGEFEGKPVYVMPSDTRTELFGSGLLSYENSAADIGGTTEVLGLLLKPNYDLEPIQPILFNLPFYFESPPFGYLYNWIQKIKNCNNLLTAEMIVCKFKRSKQLWKIRFNIVKAELFATESLLEDKILLTIAAEVSLILKKFESKGASVKKLLVSGGSSVNQNLNQLKSDLTQKEVLVPLVKDTTALGSAVLLFTLNGKYNDLFDASQNLFKVKERYQPKNNYDSFFKKYVYLKNRF